MLSHLARTPKLSGSQGKRQPLSTAVAGVETHREKARGFSAARRARLLSAGAVILLLGACTVPSIRTAGDAEALNVVAVDVDTSQMAVVVEGRSSTVTAQQLDDDLTSALTAALASSSDPAGRSVNVSVTMEQFRLAPPIERVVAGTSTATGVVSVTDAQTGDVVVAPTRMSGNTENFRAASVLGIATTRTVDKDYRGTVNGYAETARKAIFPDPE